MSSQLHDHILDHLPRMLDWYEWEGCDLVYLPMHQSGSGTWNTTSEYLRSKFPLVSEHKFSELLKTLHEPSNRLISRLISNTDLAESAADAFLFYTDSDLLTSKLPFIELAKYAEGTEDPLSFFSRGFGELWEIKNYFHNYVPKNEAVSRLVIDKHLNIFLRDYENVLIELYPLPKTIFLFYLNHPEGVGLPFLRDHKVELEGIYAKITNSSDPGQIRKNIEALVDPLNNSINEKCSNIKRAFLNKIDGSKAKYYLISGPRGGLKQISLDRELVTYEN